MAQRGGNCVDYDALWAQLGASARLIRSFCSAFRRPKSLKPNHRARTLRKRWYKLALRQAVALTCQTRFYLPVVNACLEIVY